MTSDFVTDYMRLCNLGASEAPAMYHRWCALSAMGAYLGRQVYVNFGIGNIYPNQYIMLMGAPGTRKGTAMSIGKKLLKAAGYTRFAKDKTSKERFLMDMKHIDESSAMLEDLEVLAMDTPAESYVMAPEFTDWIGQGNMDFVMFLTNVWDNLDKYEHPKIHGKSVEVFKPTVNMLGCNTAEGFALAFPPEALGTGFLSRTLMLYAEVTGKRVAFPEPTDELLLHDLANRMIEVRKNIKGEIVLNEDGRAAAKEIYENEIPVDDPRFTHYQQRRYIHMLKIATLLSVYNGKEKITDIEIVRANTALVAAEKLMPKALGEFGASRYSMVSGKILAYLNTCTLPQNSNDLWKVVSRDLTKMTEMIDILQGMQVAEKIQKIEIAGKSGYLPLRKASKTWPDYLLDLQWLTETERITLS